MEENKGFLQQAIDLARENVEKGGGGPFGALIVKDGKIIGEGVNRVTANNDPTAHAEILAIRDACKNLNSFQLEDCIIYASCEPCPMCLGAVYWARPKMLVFAASHNEAAQSGFDDSFIYHEISTPYEKRSIKTLQLKTGDYLKPFKVWDKINRKIEY